MKGAALQEGDYGHGQIISDFFNELRPARAGVPQDQPLHEDTVSESRPSLHKSSARPRPFSIRAAAPTIGGNGLIAYFRSCGFCSGHSASGVFFDDGRVRAAPLFQGSYSASECDMAIVPQIHARAFTTASVRR